MPILRSASIQHKLGDLLARNLAASNVLGRMQILDEVRKKTGKRLPIATSSRMPRHQIQPQLRRAIHFAEQTLNDNPGYNPADLLPAGFSVSLPNDRAAEFLRSLTPVTRATFDGLTRQYQADAFTLAGTSDVRLIQKIRDQLASTLHEGATRADFRAAVHKLTTDEGVAELNAFTLDTAFNTAMHKAYALGRYEQLEEPAVIQAVPFRQYLTAEDDRVRVEHAVLDGFVAKAVDPVWRKIYPPNGFNCRCIVISMLDSEALDADPRAADDGMLRLPALAIALVPQPGFGKVFATPIAA